MLDDDIFRLLLHEGSSVRRECCAIFYTDYIGDDVYASTWTASGLAPLFPAREAFGLATISRFCDRSEAHSPRPSRRRGTRQVLC
jgi:hypothetical protein